MNTSPSESKPPHNNAYQVAPKVPGDEKGYDTADAHNADEGYTAENVLRRHGEATPWGRTGEGSQGDDPDQ